MRLLRPAEEPPLPRRPLNLGLALVEPLVALHRGHTDIFASRPGEGCEIVISLPRLSS